MLPDQGEKGFAEIRRNAFGEWGVEPNYAALVHSALFLLSEGCVSAGFAVFEGMRVSAIIEGCLVHR